MRNYNPWLLLAAALAFALGAQAKLIPLDENAYHGLVKQQAGKVVLVDFWAGWCVPCREEMPALVKLARRYGPQGLQFLTVSIDSPAELAYAEKFLRSKSVPFPSYYKSAKKDEDFINSVDPLWSGALPALFFYSREGKLVRSYIGETEEATVEAAIRELLAERKP